MYYDILIKYKLLYIISFNILQLLYTPYADFIKFILAIKSFVLRTLYVFIKCQGQKIKYSIFGELFDLIHLLF